MTSCIIVGAGSGIGVSLARRFARGGQRVGLIARRESALRGIANDLASRGVDVAWRSADAGNSDELRLAIDRLEHDCGPCSTLIYNAAVLRPETPLALAANTLRAEFDVNAVGALVAAIVVAPGMLARGSGAILFTGGGLALEPYPEWTSLAMGKSALRSLAFSLYKELAPRGVHVSVIAICGIVARGGPFDPDVIAEEYWRLATKPKGVRDREFIFQPPGADPYYNDPVGRHRNTTPATAHRTRDKDSS